MTNAEIIKAQAQMCIEGMCSECPMSHFNNDKNMDCEEYRIHYPYEAVEMIELWVSKGMTNARWWAMHFRSLGLAVTSTDFKKECPKLFKGGVACPHDNEAVSVNEACVDCKKWWEEKYQGDM